MKRYTTGYIKFITDEEFSKIKNYIENKIKSPSMKMALKVQIFLGLRCGEIVNLKRSNFNKNFSILTFKILKRKKKNIKERKIPKILQKDLIKYNKKYKKKFRDGFLFFPYKNQSKKKHFSRDAIINKFMIIRNNLNLKQVYYTRKDGNKLYRLSSHTIRHYAIWRIYKATGKDIIATQRIIGHAKTETTSNYINHIEAKLKEQEIINLAWKNS